MRTDVYDADVSTDNHPQDIFTQTEDEYSKRMTLMQSSGGTTSAPGASCWSSAATAATEQHREVRTLRK